jgi:hypothetical protein
MSKPNLYVGLFGDEVAKLHNALTQSGVEVPASEVARQFFGPGTRQAVQQLQQTQALPVTGDVDAATHAVLSRGTEQVTISVGSPQGSGSGSGGQHSAPNTLQGNLVFDHGLPGSGVKVRLYDVGFGGRETRLGEVQSDPQGKYSFSYSPSTSTPNQTVNLQVRALDPAGKEIRISATKYNASPSDRLNLVVPARVQPLAPEFQRLSSDMSKTIGGVANLGQAQEGSARQDLSLLNQSTNWDARIVALGATAAQNTAPTGLGHDVLYALHRVGLPTDPAVLATVPSAAVKQGLIKATQAGIVNFNSDQIAEATSAFESFSSKALLNSTAAGTASNFNDLLSAHLQDPTQRAAFSRLYFSQPADLWAEAAKLPIAAPTLSALKLQGKFLYLTFNNGILAQHLQQNITSEDNLPQLADRDFHKPDTWQNTLTALAAPGGVTLDSLIPPAFKGATTADRLAAYSGDLARKVRISFPTRTVARMVETNDIAVDPKTSGNVTNFLRTADPLGYSLGRTPLNAFLANTKGLPALDNASKQSVKTLHRLFQVTPSTESLQAAVKIGFTSARDIASYSKTDFISNYAFLFPPGEAEWVYGQAQTISSVTFNIFSIAKGLDTSAPVYALSSSSADRKNAKNALVQQFPSMATLFGNLDFCQCEDCRSVLSPAAYFVDLLDMLNLLPTNPNHPVTYVDSNGKTQNVTPLDILLGNSDAKIGGRRPDLGALPLSCSNTNTAMPYIDLVNEILEYYIAHNSLGAGAAYDTGSATTADLTAEPQHILPDVYTKTLETAVYPLNLPFDLWIATVRGFLNYFKTSLAQVLDTLRPADTLELFVGNPATPYYRAQILAEALGISPSEYAVFTATDTTAWFKLYGYAAEAAALNDLKNAKTLSQKLGVSYQGLTDLVKTGFLNPDLYPLIFQFERFGIDMGTAFAFTGQPGFPALSASDTTAFQALLDGITVQYKQQNPKSKFNATNWLNELLTANYSTRVLVLEDPNAGCNFGGTTLQYADGSAAKPLDFLKLNLLVRLCNKLGCDLTDGVAPPDVSLTPWSLDEIDRALQAFFPIVSLPFTDAGFSKAFGSAWATALVYLAHLDDLNTRLSPALGRVALLPLWADLPVQGENSLYAQLFLTPSVLNNDFAFDDPRGGFPAPSAELADPTLEGHSAAVQGVLSLSAADVSAILTDASVAAPAQLTLDNLSICYRYSQLAQCLQLSVSNLIVLKTLSGLNPFQALSGGALKVLADDVLLNQTLAFVTQTAAVQNSGFTVEDLQYLLRHQFDPVGKYRSDRNALTALIQAIAGGIAQIQSQNTVPSDPASLPESLIDQSLSRLFPEAILRTLFTQVTNSQTYTVSTTSLNGALTPSDFASAPELSNFTFDPVTNTQTVSFTGLLLDWRMAELQQLNQSALLNGVVTTLLTKAQQAAQDGLAKSVADVLGVWASLVEYKAVASPVAQIPDPLGQLTQTDPSLSLSYDSSDQLQWLGYRGVLTAAKQSALTAINASATLASLLTQVQLQALPAYNLLTGTLLAMWCNLQSYKFVQNTVAPGSQVDPAAFSAALAQAQHSGAITGPVPAIQITYDSNAKVQTMICSGVLTDALRIQLATLIPAPPAVANLLANLLQTVRNQAVAEFQRLATGLLANTINDPDPFVAPFLGADSVKQQKFGKAELVAAVLPALVQKLSRQLAIQTLTANLGSDQSLTEALITDAALLNDPSNPGKSLLQTFLAVGQPGVSVSYFDASSALLAQGIAGSADTADSKVPAGAAVRGHFEGFLQVPTDGPYRFFAELGNAGTEAVFHLDSPDPSVLFSNPVIQATASAGGQEASQFVQLKAGVAYHFTLDFFNLGASGASMLVQGENLPKGPLNRIVLYPQQSVDAFARARVLLSKVLQILQVTGLDLRGVSYLVAHANQFNNLRLSSLPSQPSDDSPSNAVKLFSQFLTLADYADLRKGPAGGSDGLVEVFQVAATPAGVTVIYYSSANETGQPQAPPALAATTDTADPSNKTPGMASCRFEGYLLVPVDGTYTFFAELGNLNAKVTFRLDSPPGIVPLANPIVLQQTAAKDGDEASQAVSLKSGAAYHLTLDFQSLGAKGASLLVRSASLPKGPLNQLLLYPVSQLPPWMVLANLTRRDPQVVQDVAAALGPDPHFANNAGIRRMWDALQLVQILRLPVAAVSASTAIVSASPAAPDQIAANFKNAVKAQYTAVQWRPIAQSVFDPLRRKKRDALVSYLVNTLQLDSSNQLFEYFLVDPGMEPIVQTSRLRLALSSVQTFVQRCLLNLEDANTNLALDIVPGAIHSDWWPWMKRYRVWEANREIFLYPENWMVPEFRLDKTDLFQALESALLQGDVTNDLVEDAFSEYLKGLDLRARLQIVASYFDQKPSPADSILYILGRIFGTPHQYFFRTYSYGVWSGWQTVTINIEGDHMALAYWRGKLNLFWFTFINKAQAPTPSASDTSTGVGDLPFGSLVSDMFSGNAQKYVQLQLHWSEYVQGKWTKPIATDVSKYGDIAVEDGFDPSQVHIHVSKETDANGNEGAVKIHADFPDGGAYLRFLQIALTALSQGDVATYIVFMIYANAVLPYASRSFRVTSKNSVPVLDPLYWEAAPPQPYNNTGVDATFYTGSSDLIATYLTNIQSDGTGTSKPENILDTVQNFDLLTCANPVIPPFLPPNDPDYQDAGGLVSPFFFADTSSGVNQDERTFFVQPSLTETVLTVWGGWAIGPSQPTHYAVDPNLVNQTTVVAQVPAAGPVPVNPGDPVYSVFPMQNLTDWATASDVAISYGGVAIGKNGAIQPKAPQGAAKTIATGGLVSSLGTTNVVGAGVTVVGKQGLSASQTPAAPSMPIGLGGPSLVKS